VKKRNGQIVSGEIQGRIAQKGEVFKRDEPGFFVGYNVIEGKNIESIDERGVNLVKGATFSVVIH
jgi:hypothetical protein